MSLRDRQDQGRHQDRGRWPGRAPRRAPQEELSPGNSEQGRQTTGPPGFLPSPHRLPCQRHQVCETLQGGQWELKGFQGSLVVVTLFLHGPGEGGFLKMAIRTNGIQLLGETGTWWWPCHPRLLVSRPQAPPYSPHLLGPHRGRGPLDTAAGCHLWLKDFGVRVHGLSAQFTVFLAVRFGASQFTALCLSFLMCKM